MLPPTGRKHHTPHMSSGWRLELFFKSSEELRRQLPFLQRHQISRINLTNKSAEDDLLGSVQLLQQALPRMDVCVHYSLKYNYDRSPAAAMAKLQTFCRELKQQAPFNCHVLLVSGGCKKKAFNTVTALQQLAGNKKQKLLHPQPAMTSNAATCTLQHLHTHGAGPDHNHHHQQQQQQCSSHNTATGQSVVAANNNPAGSSRRKRPPLQPAGPAASSSHAQAGVCGDDESGYQLPPLAVAFNPYLPDPQEAEAERSRLRDKLATGLVDRVYLQMGTDLARLTSGLKFLQDLVQQQQQQQQDQGFVGMSQAPQLLGSVFIPSKRLLAQMKFRPWNGVFLSEQYLSGVEAADAITKQLLAAYAAAGVVPLVETAVKTDEEVERVKQLLELR